LILTQSSHPGFEGAKKQKINIFRWLIANGRLDEAEKILRQISLYNGKPLPLDFKVSPVAQPNLVK